MLYWRAGDLELASSIEARSRRCYITNWVLQYHVHAIYNYPYVHMHVLHHKQLINNIVRWAWRECHHWSYPRPCVYILLTMTTLLTRTYCTDGTASSHVGFRGKNVATQIVKRAENTVDIRFYWDNAPRYPGLVVWIGFLCLQQIQVAVRSGCRPNAAAGELQTQTRSSFKILTRSYLIRPNQFIQLRSRAHRCVLNATRFGVPVHSALRFFFLSVQWSALSSPVVSLQARN